MMNVERFGGIARLYGVAPAERLATARVAVVGIGGVGSWAAEALARSGVGTIILLDMDDLCITNTNRQIHALDGNYGRAKVEAMGERLREAGAEAILVDFHGETTSEKIAMGYRMDGVASAVIGTHTHVQTGDERILPGGTAYLTDAGMCGSRDGVIGRDAESVLQGLITNLPNRFPIAGFPAMVNGVLVDVDTSTGKATRIERITRAYDEK